MDALALLCTLHADGPVTLKRLRRAECSTLEAVIGLDVERLSAILGSTDAGARRFQREARSLATRVGEGILDRAQLAGGAALGIGRGSGLAYPRVARWRSRARRLAPTGRAAPARAAPAARETRPRAANDDTFSRSERATPPPEPLVRI